MKRGCSNAAKRLPTLSLGVCGYGVAYAIHMPLPLLPGSLTVTAALCLGGMRLQAPTTSRTVVLVVIGVILGAAFSADMGGDIALWDATLGIMLVAWMKRLHR
ncbi:MAG: hypothetical protein V7760_12205 [Marinobacter sp.]